MDKRQWEVFQKPEFQIKQLHSMHTLFSCSYEYRNKRLLEWVYTLLKNDVPGYVVADLMSDLYWSFDNGLVSYQSKNENKSTQEDNQND